MTTDDGPTHEAAVDDRRVLTFERSFGVPRHSVFDAWADPDLVTAAFDASDAGTRLTVTVEGGGGSWPDGAVERFRAQSERGWSRSLDRLAALPALDG